MNRTLPVLLLSFILGETKLNAQAIAFQRVDTIPVIVNNVPLNNPWAGGINFPIFSEIDLNGDGIHDLFFFDRSNNRLSTFINDGTSGVNAWHDAPQYVSKFPHINKWVRLYDYNCDGKMDLFTLSSCQCGIAVYRNDYNSTAGLQFTLVTDKISETYFTTLTNVYADLVSLPAFGDVDGDGDMDILGYNSLPDGRLLWHKNYSMEDYGTCDSLDFKLEDLHWGHFQLFIGGSNSVYCFNCRPAHPPGGVNPVTLSDSLLINYDQSRAADRDDTISSVFMLDNDGDGDKDLLIGDSGSTNSLLVVNGGTPDSAAMVSQDVTFPSYNIPVNITNFPVHSYIDLDNDTIKDLIVAPTDLENFRGMWFYKNTGTDISPVFHYQNNSFLVDQMIDVGEGACPVLFDADGDGLQDLVVGNFGIFQFGGTYKSTLHLYKNTGTATSPAFTDSLNDFSAVSSLGLPGPLYPAFGDLDGDGDMDMLIGNNNGTLVYEMNTAGAGNPAVFAPPVTNYMGIDVGNTSTPQIIDLNRDGLPDLVIGNKNGFIKYFENTGTAAAPFFSNVATKDTLGGISVQVPFTPDGYAVPFFFSENGQYKLLVSCEKGDVYLYDNIDSNLFGNYNLTDTIISGTQGTRIKFNLAVSGGDLNGDGKTDMLLGIYGGGVNIYMQYEPNGIAEIPSADAGFILAPNPANDQCEIRFSNLHAGKNQLRVMNYLGQTVFSKFFSGDKITMDTHRLPAGVYMLQLVSGEKSFSEKLMVKH